jgi:hypothetical protein
MRDMQHKVADEQLKQELRIHVDGDGMWIPSYMEDGLLRYLVSGTRPGNFLFHLLCGELFEAYLYADNNNRGAIGAYCDFLFRFCNDQCYGSKEKVMKWLDVARAAR